MIPLPALEEVIDASGTAARVEGMLPSGACSRQLSVRTLLLGMMLTLADGRPAHLTRVHRALTGLPEGEQRRPGVLAAWADGPHLLTYRQAEYTFPEASWGHRRNNLLHDEDGVFFGYYLSDAVTVADEQGLPVPELARRMTVSSCRRDPVPAFTPVLTAMPAAGIPLGDVLAGSGYSRRVPQNWASPLRKAGAALVQDLHPYNRGPRGTHQGAVIANGSLYCPQTPRTLLELAPLSRAASPRAGRAARREDRRGRPLQARPPHRRRCRRLPPRRLSRCRRQDPLPPFGRRRCSWTGTARRSSGPPGTRRPAAPSRPSPSRRTCSPRPRRNTTTPQQPGAAPTPAAPAPNAASPPPRTPPPATSPAAGAASRA